MLGHWTALFHKRECIRLGHFRFERSGVWKIPETTIGSPLLNVVFHDHLFSPTSLRPDWLVALDLGQHSHPISTRPD